MKQVRLIVFSCVLVMVHFTSAAQAYIKFVGHAESSPGLCDGAVDLYTIGSPAPYTINWSNGTFSPSAGMRTEDICNGTIITMDLLDGDCRHLSGHIYIDSDPSKQLSLDTILITMPSAPGICDGSIEFRIDNVYPGCTRHFSTPGSGWLTTDSVFTGLCDEGYGYSIYSAASSVLYEVHVDLSFPGAHGPCEPLIDSIELIPPTTSTSCNGELHVTTTGATGTVYHKIYKLTASGLVQINTLDIYSNVKTGLCQGPYVVESYSTANNYSTYASVYIDDPEIADSSWGAPPMDTLVSSGVDTILLSALTTCGLDYTVNVDSAYVSDYYALDLNYYNVEITLVQDTAITHVYTTAYFDTTHVICFDITLFCADSTFLRAGGGNYSSRNIIFLNPFIDYNSIRDLEMDEDKVLVFPNPFNDQVLISAEFNLRNIVLYYTDGSLVSEYVVNGKWIELNLSHEPAGIYIAKIIGQNEEIKTLKLIKTN